MSTYINSIKKRAESYKELADKTFAQLSDEQLYWQFNEESNSIAVIVQHLAGNMLSRWTDFLTTDGEKPWRKRDEEFESKTIDRKSLLDKWNEGWACMFSTLDTLTESDLEKEILIRSEPHTVTDAINRQLGHFAYHVGQIVFVGKMLKSENWQSLSVPRGGSDAFNAQKFSQPKP